jgi:hypothetical protein
VEHFWGDNGDTDADNGLHREGSARCFINDTAPTILKDTSKVHDNTGGTPSGTLSALAVNSGGDPEDAIGHGRCWLDSDDNYRLYIYESDVGWVAVLGERVRAGARNLLQNGDFDWDGCVSEDVDPTGWTGIDAETIDYVEDPLTTGLQGEGCQVEITDVDGGDGLTQTLAGLKANTTYRVVAQVLEDGADQCNLTTTGANQTEITTEMVSVDNTAFAQLEGFFVTTADAIDSVAINLINKDAGDICIWDHIAVYRQETVEVPEAGIVAVQDSLPEAEVVSDSCNAEDDPWDCCTASGAGATCDITSSFQDVPELSITFVPPTEGWMISIRANISMGTTSASPALNEEGGHLCQLEKGGTLIAGTIRGKQIVDSDSSGGEELKQITTESLEVNPVAGTSITYTVACRYYDTDNDYYYNPTIVTLVPTSSLTMIAYPPH